MLKIKNYLAVALLTILVQTQRNFLFETGSLLMGGTGSP